MEEDLRLHRCCFTGHRPEKMKMSEDEIKPLLKAEIEVAISDGITTFITGMAPGVDIWAGEIVLEIKKENPDIKLIAAMVFKLRIRRKSNSVIIIICACNTVWYIDKTKRDKKRFNITRDRNILYGNSAAYERQLYRRCYSGNNVRC